MSADPAQAAAPFQSAVRGVDADLPIENVRSLDGLREGYLATPKLTADPLTVFAGPPTDSAAAMRPDV